MVYSIDAFLVGLDFNQEELEAISHRRALYTCFLGRFKDCKTYFFAALSNWTVRGTTFTVAIKQVFEPLKDRSTRHHRASAILFQNPDGI